jgi:hypothetical protein
MLELGVAGARNATEAGIEKTGSRPFAKSVKVE